ncbi:MAG: hypothetical protein RJA44_1625, partial [Pseudomonadota bacterium]
MVHHTMNTSNSPAPRASTTINHMLGLLPCAARGWAAALILGSLLGCSLAPARPPLAVYPEAAPATSTTAMLAPLPEPALHGPPPTAADTGPVRTTGRGRWIQSDWGALPGWQDDQLAQAWPALLRSCDKPAVGWAATCKAARELSAPDERTVRQFLRERLQPWRVETSDGRSDGMMTGYFEPYIQASRTPTARFSVPLHALPAELMAVQALGLPREPWYTRAQIESLPEARAALRGRELAWVADPLDALLMQIQGSGRMVFSEPDGRRQV